MAAIDVYLDDDIVSTTFAGRSYEGMGLEITGPGEVSWSPGVLHVSHVEQVREAGRTVEIRTGGGSGGFL